MVRLILEGMIRYNTINMRSKRATPAVVQSMDTFTEPTVEEEMLQLWEEGKRIDKDYKVLI